MKTYRQSRSTSVLITIIAYLVAIAGAIYSYNYFDTHTIIVRLAIADIVGTLIIFIFSVLFNNSSMYDPYWSVKPVVIATFFLSMAVPGEYTFVRWGLYIGVFLYGLRLTTNFYRGWPGLVHEDWRYANFRKQFPGMYWLVSLSGIHIFPTLMVFLGCLPMLPAFTASPIVYPWLAYAGLAVLLFSVWLAFIADEQLRKIRQAEHGKRVMTGLWKSSRHPNYLGEILTWWGIFMVGLSFGTEYLWTGAGALAITLMFVFISIPLIEKHMIKRDKTYLEYRESVPFLLPIKLKSKK
jgi:steroid 5-alpha reductase family enzyme